jgi:hypothetical protein
MALDTKAPSSRRALLAASVGGVAALAADAFARPLAARAATGDTVKVGGGFTATSATEITNATTSADVLVGVTRFGTGVVGLADTGTGVVGFSNSGAGVVAQASPGYALQTRGRITLSTSGVATILAGATTKVVTPGVDMDARSFVLLTPAVDIGTRRLWYALNTTANTITIHLSSSRASTTKVSWLLLG